MVSISAPPPPVFTPTIKRAISWQPGSPFTLFISSLFLSLPRLGVARLVKSPPQKKRHTRNQSESDNGVARHRLPPLPRKNQRGKTSTALGKGAKPKPAVARRVSSLPKPIQQVPKQQETRRNAQTQTDAAAARGVEDPSRQGQRWERDDIVREVRMCGDLVLEMVSDACELGELYKKERRRGSRRRQGGCCCAVM